METTEAKADVEFEALRVVIETLLPLPADVRIRILRYASDRYGR